MLLSILGVTALVALVILVLLLREVLAIPLPAQVELRAVAAMRPPAPLAPLFERADEQLRDLGFEPLTWVLLRFQPDGVPTPRLLRLYRSEDCCTIAQVMAPMTADQALRCRIHFVSDDRDGRLLFTVPTQVSTIPIDPDLAITQIGHYADLQAQWRAHRHLLANHVGAALPWLDRDQVLRRLQAYEHGTTLRALHLGSLQPHADGSLRLGSAQAARSLAHALRQNAPAPAVEEGNSDTQLAVVWQNWKRLRRHTPRQRVQLGLFVLSALAFALAFAWWLDLRFALLLLAVIAFHEGGHWWAMRRLGYGNVQVLMLPMLGGVTIGHEQHPRARDRAWVSLMGPLPGIALGLALFASGIDVGDGWLYLLALLLVLVNLFNLLPVLPLDGGHLLHSLLPERAATVRMAFDAAAVLALFALAWWLDAWWLALFALVPASNLRNSGRDRRWLAALREAREHGTGGTDELAEAAQASAVLRSQPDAPPLLPARIVALDQVLTQARLEPMARANAITIAILWIACFAFSLSLPQVRSLAGILLQSDDAQMAVIEQEFRTLRDEAAALGDDELVARVADVLRAEGTHIDRDESGAAIETELAAAQRRLGITLHPVYRALQRHRLPPETLLDVVAPARLDWLRNRPDCLELLDRHANWRGFSDNQPLAFSVHGLGDLDEEFGMSSQVQTLQRSTLLGWLAIGPCDRHGHSVRLIEANQPDWPMWQFLLHEPAAVRHASLREPLESIHVNHRFQQVLRERFAD